MNGNSIRACPACKTPVSHDARYCCLCGVPITARAGKAGEGFLGPGCDTLPARLERLLLEELVRVDWTDAPPAALFGSLREWMHTRLDLDPAYPIEAITIAALDAAIDFARVQERLLARSSKAAARLGLRATPRLRVLPPPPPSRDEDDEPARYTRRYE